MSNIKNSSHFSATLPSLVILRLLGHRDRKQGLLAGALLAQEESFVDGADVDGMLVLGWILLFLQGWRQLNGTGSSTCYRAARGDQEMLSELTKTTHCILHFIGFPSNCRL